MKQEGPTRDLSHGIPWLHHKTLVARVNPPGSTIRSYAWPAVLSTADFQCLRSESSLNHMPYYR